VNQVGALSGGHDTVIRIALPAAQFRGVRPHVQCLQRRDVRLGMGFGNPLTSTLDRFYFLWTRPN
jgi:hypothetical protein